MFNKDYLEKANFEFAIITDTHYMKLHEDQPLEFENRRLQPSRATVSTHLADNLGADFVMHLGDLIQEYPESPDFVPSMQNAVKAICNCRTPFHIVPGNQDVGDKHDPTMPAPPVDTESLNLFHDIAGPSWHAFSHGDARFIWINAMILNSDLDEAKEQKAWLEEEMRTHQSERQFLFLHIPVYLENAQEESMGHYESIAQPDRDWLMSLIETHEVEMVASGHVHFSFFDKHENTSMLIASSPSFSRPNFPYIFHAEAPEQRGREDREKLGIYLVRVFDDHHEIHFIQTDGETKAPSLKKGEEMLLTRVSSKDFDSRLGVNLREPLATWTRIPQSWPSSIRTTVRNDYPLMRLCELGAGHAKTPLSDFDDEKLNGRLQILRSEGIKLIATLLVPDANADLDKIVKHAEKYDELEIIHVGKLIEAKHDGLREVANVATRPINLNQWVFRENVSGKQFPRGRQGFLAEELEDLQTWITAGRIDIERVCCYIQGDIAENLKAIREHRGTMKIDATLNLDTQDDRELSDQVASAIFHAHTIENCRLTVDPLVDLDRSMDVSLGLLNRHCNPRTAFKIAATINTLLPADETFTLANDDAIAKAGSTHYELLIRDEDDLHTRLCERLENSDGIFNICELKEKRIHHFSTDHPFDPDSKREWGDHLLIITPGK